MDNKLGGDGQSDFEHEHDLQFGMRAKKTDVTCYQRCDKLAFTAGDDEPIAQAGYGLDVDRL